MHACRGMCAQYSVDVQGYVCKYFYTCPSCSLFIRMFAYLLVFNTYQTPVITFGAVMLNTLIIVFLVYQNCIVFQCSN